jgi:hypothetical protein
VDGDARAPPACAVTWKGRRVGGCLLCRLVGVSLLHSSFVSGKMSGKVVAAVLLAVVVMTVLILDQEDLLADPSFCNALRGNPLAFLLGVSVREEVELEEGCTKRSLMWGVDNLVHDVGVLPWADSTLLSQRRGWKGSFGDSEWEMPNKSCSSSGHIRSRVCPEMGLYRWLSIGDEIRASALSRVDLYQ